MADNSENQSPADLQRLINLIQHYTDYQNGLVLNEDGVADILANADLTDEERDNLVESTQKQEAKPTTVIIQLPGDFDAS